MKEQLDARKIVMASDSGMEKARETGSGKDKGKGVLRSTVPVCPLKCKVSVFIVFHCCRWLISDRYQKMNFRKWDWGLHATSVLIARRHANGQWKGSSKHARGAMRGALSALSGRHL